jgi:hypothetical protein
MPPVAYNSQALPFFTPDASAGASVVSPATDTGYDIRATRLGDARRTAALSRANGALSNSREKVLFFVNEIKIDLGISGSTGQGRRTRDFYPHNIIMPSYVVEGHCLDQQDYGTLVEFVHKLQQEAVGNVRAGNLTQLDVLKGGIKTRRPIMRGVRKPICAQGFVEEIGRTYKAGTYAPTFTFNVVVAFEFTGLYRQIGGYEPTQESWWEILQGMKPYTSQVEKSETAKNSKPTSTTQEPAATPVPTGEQIHQAGF